jgi:hypothetical protein
MKKNEKDEIFNKKKRKKRTRWDKGGKKMKKMKQKKNTFHGMEGTLRGLLQKWVSQGGWGTQINKEKLTSVITFFVSGLLIGESRRIRSQQWPPSWCNSQILSLECEKWGKQSTSSFSIENILTII